MKGKALLCILALTTAASVTNTTDACTNIIITKGASADGSCMVSYAADSHALYGELYFQDAADWEPGSTRKIIDWDSGRYLGDIEQVAHTYKRVGNMNEHQLIIGETTFGGRPELMDKHGVVDYGSLIYIALERCKTAREAIECITSLANEYGYYSEGESFSVCDKNEAWILEMIGKGAGEKGAVWAAVRIPDDCVSAHANQSRITRLSQFGKKQVLCSKDVIKFARQKGYFTGKDADFSFRDAYAPNDFGAVRFCEARVWSIFHRLCEGMDQYVEYAKGNDLKGEMPLYMKPKQKVGVQDVMNVMRDHYEDTPFDILNELGAGPYNMPYRPTPLEWKSGDKEYFNERPVSTQQTSFSFVGQMRSQYPDAVGGIVWVTNDDPNMAPYVPLYCSIKEVPRCFRRIAGIQDDVTFSWESAFWLQNSESNMVYPYYSKMFVDLVRARDILEKSFLDEVQASQADLVAQYEADPSACAQQLQKRSSASAREMMDTWQQLFQYLTVRHLDMATKKVDEKQNKIFNPFLKTEHGIAEPPLRPGYPENYRKAIVEETGEKYEKK